MRSAPPVRPDARPPLASPAATSAGEALRPTVRFRQQVAIRLGEETSGFLPTDPYVGKFWLAIVGPSALTDLLRLSQAARREEKVLRPIHLRPLLEVGLVQIDREGLVVRRRIPQLPPPLVGQLPVHLRRQHAAWLDGLAVPEGA